MTHSGDEQRVALVTGASSGIGLVTARMLAERGFRAFGTSRNPRGGGDVTMLPLDATEPTTVTACVDTVLRAAGRLDVLVNNIGGGIAGAVEEVSIDEARAVFDANLWSAFQVTQAALHTMRAQGSGHIVAMSSMAGLTGVPYRGVYTASKFALESMFEALRHEVAPLGISVSLVKPTGVATPAADRVPVAARQVSAYQPASRNISARFDQNMRDGLPPERVARTILRIVDTPRPRLRYLVGPQVRLLNAAQRALPQRLSVAAAARLFRRLGSDRVR